MMRQFTVVSYFNLTSLLKTKISNKLFYKLNYPDKLVLCNMNPDEYDFALVVQYFDPL